MMNKTTRSIHRKVDAFYRAHNELTQLLAQPEVDADHLQDLVNLIAELEKQLGPVLKQVAS
jgi:F0F1-type ATP synthase delta subunit